MVGCSRSNQGSDSGGIAGTDQEDWCSESSRPSAELHAPGTSWDCEDGCNVCSCEEGVIFKTDRDCRREPGPVPGFSGPVFTPPMTPRAMPGPPVACEPGERAYPSEAACARDSEACRSVWPGLWCGSEEACCEELAVCDTDEVAFEEAFECVDAAGRQCRLVSVCCSTVYCAPEASVDGSTPDDDAGVAEEDAGS